MKRYSIIEQDDVYYILKERGFSLFGCFFSISGELIPDYTTKWSQIPFYNLIDAENRLEEFINPKPIELL